MVEKLLKPRSQFIIIGSILSLVILYNLAFEWPSSIQVPLKQEAFLIAIEEGDNGAWNTLISESYEDQWGFSKSNAMVAMQDVRSQFIGLSIDWVSRSTVIDSATATGTETGTLTGTMKFDATGLFATDLITRRINSLDAPWVFVWRKESWIPWSWKLVRIENPDLDLGRYSPGDLKRSMGNNN